MKQKYTDESAKQILNQYNQDKNIMSPSEAVKKAGVSKVMLSKWGKKFNDKNTTRTTRTTTSTNSNNTPSQFFTFPTNNRTVVALIGDKETVTNCVKNLLT